MTPGIFNNALSTSYESILDHCIVSAVRRGAHDLWDLISILPGYYPTIVREAVVRLVGDAVIPSDIAGEGLATDVGPQAQLEIPGLPVPHPLDYDWRFTGATAGRLLESLVEMSGPTNSAALLGAPSVYRLAERERLVDRLILLDKNRSMANSEAGPLSGGKVYCCNLMHGAPSIPPVHAVLADPPWYVDEAVGFLRTASQISAKGATILLSFAPEGMRPGIPDERKRIIGEARSFGLSFFAIDHLALSYATPFFEYNSLRASGFQRVAAAWRRGDLLSFRKTASPYVLQNSVNADEMTWEEVSINGVRFRVRHGNMVDFADPRLKKLVEGDILPTVSRRGARRKQVEVWTTGNRVYSCDGSNVLTAILHAMQASENPVPAAQQILPHPINDRQARLVQSTALQVEQIVQTEILEMKTFTNGQGAGVEK